MRSASRKKEGKEVEERGPRAYSGGCRTWRWGRGHGRRSPAGGRTTGSPVAPCLAPRCCCRSPSRAVRRAPSRQLRSILLFDSAEELRARQSAQAESRREPSGPAVRAAAEKGSREGDILVTSHEPTTMTIIRQSRLLKKMQFLCPGS